MKDWTGDANSIFKTLGASSHAEDERQREDYYATDPIAAELLLNLETFDKNIWECACGEGHISKVLINAGFNVKSTDLIERGFGDGVMDFLSMENQSYDGDIITNPPYKYALEFVNKSLSIIPKGNKVAMFLKLQFMETKGRKNLFLTTPPKTIHVSSLRILCAKNGDFNNRDSSAVAYAWYIWEKGYKGETIIKWFN